MKKVGKERINWPVTILLIAGLITVVFPLYMTVVIALKKPSEMTNDVAGILSLPKHFSLSNFTEAMKVTDFWNSLGNSLLITVVTVVLAMLIHSLLGYAIARNKAHSKFYKFIYLEAFQRFSFYFISLAEMPRAFISEYPRISCRKFPPGMGCMAKSVMRLSSSSTFLSISLSWS